ncbi:MAG: homoserine dehydrogenase [bacterium]|nr:homoserine dehydrogenase [bacterium]MDE0290159.1 homoserine dehydrogenase [bacterium]MDE0440001.1 homoserine dehydrogenase [bacterium]
MSMEIGVGFLGAGTVGSALIRRLIYESDAISSKTGLQLAVRGIAVRDTTKQRGVEIPPGLLTDDPGTVVDNPDVRIVVEVMGGLEPAGELALRALRSGKAVVTANKELMAARGSALLAAAEDSGVSLLFEAAVGGGIPIIRPLSESLAGERITSVMGIVNGTTNFILTRMIEDRAPYDEVLAEAQRLGYAEADPAADVKGADAASKAAILASLAFGSWVDGNQVPREGIEGLQLLDFDYARTLGYTPKLLAIAEDSDDGVAVRVHPTLVPVDHPLASVRGATNAVFVSGPSIGELLFTGPGAGGEPTATAILGDVIACARELLARNEVRSRIRFAQGRVRDMADVTTKWFLRFTVVDRPGVLARIAAVFGSHDVSIKSVWQEGRGVEATLLLVTHESPERHLQAAVSDLAALDVVSEVATVLRVHGDEP